MSARRIRSVLATTVTLVLFMTGESANAQFLDLDPLPGRPDTTRGSVLDSVSDEIRLEIDSLRGLASEDGVVGSITNALLTYRRLTFRLLAEARAEPDADHAAVAGLFLADKRQAIDELIATLAGGPPRNTAGNTIEAAELVRLLALLDTFSASGSSLLDAIDASDSNQLDAALPLAFEPLLEILLSIEEKNLEDPWPSRIRMRGTPSERLRSVTGKLRDPSRREKVGAVIANLGPLLEYADLRQAAITDMNTIADALLLESAVDEANWLSAPNREGVLSRLDESLVRWHETDSRRKTRVEMAHFGSLAELVSAANQLDKLDPRTRAMRRTIDEIVIEQVESRSVKVLESRMRSIERIIPAIEAASRIRDIRTTPPPGHLLAARRVLDRVYLRAERAVFEHLPEIVASEAALNDPELMGMIIRQGELAQDLELLRSTDTWQDLVMAHAPGEVKRHTRAIEMLANRLGQPSRRDGARLALESMKRQFEAAIHPPFLGRIRNDDQDAINLTGGRDRELLAAFRSSLQELILDWSDGAPDDGGASRFDLVLRLLDQLETLSVLLEAGGSDQLNAWGGWMLAGSSGRLKLSALQSRLKIAIEFLLAGHEDSLRKQLHEFDTQVPFTRLAVRTGSVLGDTIRNLPEGVAAGLAKIAVAPGKDDLLLAYRADLMTLARFTWELQEARMNGEQEQADDIEAYCTALAGMIADDLENRRYILPELDPIDEAGGRNMESMNGTR